MGVTSAFDQYIRGNQMPFGGRVPSELVGQTIDNKYRLDAEIGVGGMGVVYRATRLLIGDTVAVKIILPAHVSNQQSIQRFRREAQATALLKHPNAVALYDFGTTSEGLVYLVMELVEGHSLRQIIREQGPLSPYAASVVINQVCAALDEAHRRNLIHRDIKPDNIVITSTSSGVLVKVLDFGLAKLLDPERTASNLTQTGTVMGTPYYMSPEQFLGEDLDSRSDIYSLGIVLYEMLTGLVPFSSPTPTAVVVQHVNQPPASLRTRNASIPPAVEAVVLRALEKRREARQQTAGELAQQLSAAVRGEAIGHQASPSHVSEKPALSPPVTGAGSRETIPTMVVNTPPSGSNMFTSALHAPQAGAPPSYRSGVSQSRSGKKLVPIIVALVFALGLTVGVAAWWLQSDGSATQTPPNNSSKQTNQRLENSGSGGAERTAKQVEKEEKSAADPADSELASLRERRRSATSLELPKVSEDLKEAESKYPEDYRFTYEQAKIFISGVTKHDEPFELLYLAGRKAIESGKADEMLAELERDKGTDFRKLSRGHSEWNTLKTALSGRDKTLLTHSPH